MINLILGAQVALSTQTFLFCLLGVSVGMFIGVLPGVGPMAAIFNAAASDILRTSNGCDRHAGGYLLRAAQYGGSVASILLRMPGTASSAVVCLDGYEMTRNGRAGVALFISAIASFLGGSIGILIMTGFAPQISQLALHFGSPEFFMLMALGLIAAATLSEGSTIRSLAMVVLGIVIGLVGLDLTSGTLRFTYGHLELMDGVSLVASAMGLFWLVRKFCPISDARKTEWPRPVYLSGR